MLTHDDSKLIRQLGLRIRMRVVPLLLAKANTPPEHTFRPDCILMSRKASRPAIVTPFVDGLTCGGLSILCFLGLVVYGILWPEDFTGLDKGNVDAWKSAILLGVLINSPHFMASYRLLYSARDNLKKHPWATMYVPAVLVSLAILAGVCLTIGYLHGEGKATFQHVVAETGVAGAFRNHLCWAIGFGIENTLLLVSVFYLAWHYTGQSWGMTASFAYMAGVRFDAKERRMIRAAYRSMLVAHVLLLLLQLSQPIEAIMGLQPGSLHSLARPLAVSYFAIAAVVTIPMGLLGFQRANRRAGVRVPWRAIVPWISIYFWYLLLYVHPFFFVFVQVAHALQYLSFPLRVHVNRLEQPAAHSVVRRVMSVTLFYTVLLLSGGLVFTVPEFLELAGFIPTHAFSLSVLISLVVNTHHYFVDGTIWKISNPEVRRDLFWHLDPTRT